MVNAVTQLTNEVSALRDQITSHRHHVATVLAGVEASLRSEILGSDRRGELVEADLMRLSVATAALQERLDALVVNLATAADDAGASDTDATGSASTDPVIAEVRRLPGNRVT
jgi:hypothetical protein